MLQPVIGRASYLLLVSLVALAALLGTPAMSASARSTDPLCTASYGAASGRTGAPLRFGVDPGIAGSAGGTQTPATPDDPVRSLAAMRALRPAGRALVARLNRLFWSDGAAGIAHFKTLVSRYTRAGIDAELQVRYHPPPGEVGNLAAWVAYVRHVVDVFGPNPRVVSMTITNEVNLSLSPNTSDGFYAGARDALITGIEAAHAEATRRGFTQLRFGFTYAYRFGPADDAASSPISGHTADRGSARRWASSGSTSIRVRSSPHARGRRELPHRHRAGARRRAPVLHAARRNRSRCPHLGDRERGADHLGERHGRRRTGRRAPAAGPGRAGLLGHLQRHRLPLVQPARLTPATQRSPTPLLDRRAAAVRLHAQTRVLHAAWADCGARPARAARPTDPLRTKSPRPPSHAVG